MHVFLLSVNEIIHYFKCFYYYLFIDNQKLRFSSSILPSPMGVWFQLIITIKSNYNPLWHTFMKFNTTIQNNVF